MHAAECEQLTRKGCGAVGGAFDLLNLAARFILRRERAQQQFSVALDYHQQIVEVVRDASSEPADCFHFLRLPQLFFELLPLTNILRNNETHEPASVFEFVRDELDFENAAIFAGVAPLSVVKSFERRMTPDFLGHSPIA